MAPAGRAALGPRPTDTLGRLPEGLAHLPAAWQPDASGTATAMANSSNASAPAYEYYLDYLDLLPVDERQLVAHKCESCGGRAAGPRALRPGRLGGRAPRWGSGERAPCPSSSLARPGLA